MSEDTHGEVTKLLAAIAAGSQEALNQLFNLVYEELHRIADGQMRWEREDHTLQPTALLHEAYLKLFEGTELEADNRAYFFAAAANAMRQVLVDHARKRAADKRPENRPRVPFDAVLNWLESTQQVNLLALHEALKRLERFGNPMETRLSMLCLHGMPFLSTQLPNALSRTQKRQPRACP